MKLSKEKHTRSAVANEEQNIGGILYRFPGKSIGGVKDQMCKLRSNGMPVPLLRNGYSIFNGTKYR